MCRARRVHYLHSSAIFMKIPENISLDKNAQYCLTCFNETIERFFEDDKTYYKCSSCGEVSARSLIIDENVTQWIDDKRVYWHESVGVAIKDRENRIFCLLRKIYPFEYALPAGHLDVGENAEDAARREVHEEISVSLSELRSLGRFQIHGDECRRGCDDHMWNLFTASKPHNFRPKPSNEASEWTWMTREELLDRDDIVYPLKYIIKHYGEDIF